MRQLPDADQDASRVFQLCSRDFTAIALSMGDFCLESGQERPEIKRVGKGFRLRDNGTTGRIIEPTPGKIGFGAPK